VQLLTHARVCIYGVHKTGSCLSRAPVHYNFKLSMVHVLVVLAVVSLLSQPKNCLIDF